MSRSRVRRTNLLQIFISFVANSKRQIKGSSNIDASQDDGSKQLYRPSTIGKAAQFQKANGNMWYLGYQSDHNKCRKGIAAKVGRTGTASITKFVGCGTNGRTQVTNSFA